MPKFLSLPTTVASISQIDANSDALITKEYFDDKVGELVNGVRTITENGSNQLVIDFNDDAINYHCTASGVVSLVFNNLSSNIGKGGTIMLYNSGAITSEYVLPSTAKTPLGLDIDWVLTSGAISVLSYYVYSSSQVMVNYVGDFR